ncbi:ABC transporter substrate-binding protein [Saccharophagus sp. K07]|jgi:TRAP-type mannitol/chloroaromatic compound transport system substrate-binding protein|uniref:TRAP transporter substrate-binding protein n=1 Tax=Saccharophagus sp. K07 TaxID=2283636 RepID=UPI001652229B|nr:TRAP transporter substrate-binding protein [Saccharophagus sp. K07]MBC6906076.1 ABC transporter substrate-binding protein [Saccharophagus sp. K07]
MNYRYTPWWLPAALLASLVLCVVLFAALVIRSPKVMSTTVDNGNHTSEVYRWRMVTTWPKRFPGIGLAPENFAELLRKMSNGRIQITVYGANEIVPAMGVFDAVSSGSVEMGHGAAYYWKGKIPASSFFASVPFGMNATEFNSWIHYGGGLELWREVYAPFNLVPFAGGNTGVQMGGWFNREIKSLADFKGLKMRIPGYAGEVFSRAGGTAVNIPGGELYTALQSGVIDATEWVSPYNDRAFGFQQIAKYYYYPGWQEPGPGLEFIINKKLYDSLPEDLQAMITAAARAINQDMHDEYTARNNTALKELIEHHKVDVRPFPDDVLQTLKKIAWEIYDETAAKDPTFARVWKSYREFLEDVSEYHKISEHYYYEKR